MSRYSIARFVGERTRKRKYNHGCFKRAELIEGGHQANK